jgi:IS4 transposase
VLLITNEPGREPSLAEIEERVREDWRRSRIREEAEAAIEDIVDTYDVDITYERRREPNAQRESETK